MYLSRQEVYLTVAIFVVLCYTMFMEDKVLGITEASKLLKVSKLTLKRWEKRNLISCFKIGPRKDRRYFLSEINRIRGVNNEN